MKKERNFFKEALLCNLIMKNKQISKSVISKNESAYDKCDKILKLLQKDPEAFVFLKPVNWRSLKLLDYPIIIKKPMDLSTVEKKLKKREYDTVKSFYEDLSLIWENCKTYNVEGSVIYYIIIRIYTTPQRVWPTKRRSCYMKISPGIPNRTL